jgi:hypothetical protein
LDTPEESPPKYARAGQGAGTPQPALASREGLALRDVSLGARLSRASQSYILGRPVHWAKQLIHTFGGAVQARVLLASFNIAPGSPFGFMRPKQQHENAI